MDLSDVAGQEGFSFIWKIQNYNYSFRRFHCELISPMFVLNEKDQEKWCLVVNSGFIHHGIIGFSLLRSSSSTSKKITLEIELRTGKDKFKKVLHKNILMNLNSERSWLEELQINRKELDAYLNNYSITIKCGILKVNDEALATRQCYARTLINGERITYPCALEGLEDIENGSRITKRVIIFSNVPLFIMDLSCILTENKIKIDLMQIEPFTEFFSICKISLIDADGKTAHSEEYLLSFQMPKQVWTISFIPVSQIMSNKKLYLPNGVLSLLCEFAVSSGTAYSIVERFEHGMTMANYQQLQCFKQPLKNTLERFYREGKFSDSTLRVSNKEFRIHKSILCAKSEVFNAMFERDMKGNRTGVIEIKDLDEDTASKILLFLYTDTVEEDLDLESAVRLYFAASKYKIEDLKLKCFGLLNDNITLANVCDLLNQADMHHSRELKWATENFILKYSGEIMKSEEWKKLMKENLSLASEIMHTLLNR